MWKLCTSCSAVHSWELMFLFPLVWREVKWWSLLLLLLLLFLFETFFWKHSFIVVDCSLQIQILTSGQSSLVVSVSKSECFLVSWVNWAKGRGPYANWAKCRGPYIDLSYSYRTLEYALQAIERIHSQLNSGQFWGLLVSLELLPGCINPFCHNGKASFIRGNLIEPSIL